MKNSRFHYRNIYLVLYAIAVIFGFAVIAGCTSEKKYDHPVVVVETKFGDIKVE